MRTIPLINMLEEGRMEVQNELTTTIFFVFTVTNGLIIINLP